MSIATISVLLYRNFRLKQDSQLNGVYNFELQAQQILDEARDRLGCANALLLNIHNSGGEMVVGAPLYSTVIAEANKQDPISSGERWRRMPLDQVYWNISHRLRIKKLLFLRTGDFGDSGANLLSDTYYQKGITHSIKTEVYDKLRTRYFYASFVWDDGPADTVSPHQRAIITETTNQLRLLCQAAHRRGYIQ